MMAAALPMLPRRARGFTLLEAILVIALTGIVASMVTVFMRAPITAYVDQARRAELADGADGALRRVARELARALPNSARVDPSGLWLEVLPVTAGGRYRAAPDAAGAGDWLDFDTPSDNGFDVLGPSVDVAAGDQLVVSNLGLPGADAYSGESRRALTSIGTSLGHLSYSVGASQLPFPSPSNRFQIVATPVSFGCAPGAGGTGTLRRYGGYAIQAAQPVDAAAAPLAALSARNASLVTDKVESCAFTLGGGNSARSAVVTLRLTLASGGERLTLLHQVHMDNSP